LSIRIVLFIALSLPKSAFAAEAESKTAAGSFKPPLAPSSIFNERISGPSGSMNFPLSVNFLSPEDRIWSRVHWDKATCLKEAGAEFLTTFIQ